DCSISEPEQLNPPAAGPGIWQPNPPPVPGQKPPPVLGLCLPVMRPLALQSASQFRPGPPNALTSREYADDFNQVKDLGRSDSTSRSSEQTTQARFWTDHDTRQWNDGLPRLAAARGLDLVQTARMLAMAHVAGGDAVIACFDAKYHYWFWRPYQAIPQAGTDNNPATVADPTWKPLGAPYNADPAPTFPNNPPPPPTPTPRPPPGGAPPPRRFLPPTHPPLPPRHPRHKTTPPLRAPRRRRHGRRCGSRPGGLPLPQLGPGRREARAEGGM